MDEQQLADIEKISQLFKLLSDPTRLKILTLLKQGALNVTTIGERLAMEQSAVSHQLKLLRESRLVRAERLGKTMMYQLDDHHVLDILDQTFEHIRHH